jgi:hypothetical protein
LAFGALRAPKQSKDALFSQIPHLKTTIYSAVEAAMTFL